VLFNIVKTWQVGLYYNTCRAKAIPKEGVQMRKLTLGYGVFLLALGVGGFWATRRQHKTALIPAGFGAAALGLGLIMRRKHWKRRATWAGAVVSLGGLAGTSRSLPKVPAVLRGEDVERPTAVISQSLMAVASIIHLAGSVRALWRRR
jgi:hypothetical protein